MSSYTLCASPASLKPYGRSAKGLQQPALIPLSVAQQCRDITHRSLDLLQEPAEKPRLSGSFDVGCELIPLNVARRPHVTFTLTVLYLSFETGWPTDGRRGRARACKTQDDYQDVSCSDCKSGSMTVAEGDVHAVVATSSVSTRTRRLRGDRARYVCEGPALLVEWCKEAVHDEEAYAARETAALSLHASSRLLDMRTSELILAHLPILAPHLRGLEISGFSLEVNITACGNSYPVDLGDFCQTLQDQCSHLLLVNINIALLYSNSTKVLPSTALQPLYAFHNLETLSIDSRYNIAINDNDMMSMALAWPRLRVLSFLHIRSQPRPFVPAVTLQGLVPLVENCPDLEDVILDIDASNTEVSVDARPGGGSSNSLITRLRLGPSSVAGEPVKMAAFLSDLFPHLKNIDCQVEGSGSSAWAEAERHLLTFAAARVWALKHAGLDWLLDDP
ncbi:hypothetical protein IEO21_05090 [Rhodonia placenta]|uniref:Uncharacterized protein n=1 Tax=Rhodonia placenta TaxID=104341 RepID=A0A8H7U1X2_9APHY|nr:hypothetical protein IEO21_05090 [Postia placenta]